MPWKRRVYSPFECGFRWRRVLSPGHSILNLLLFPQRQVEYVAQEVIRATSTQEGVLVVAGRGPTDRGDIHEGEAVCGCNLEQLLVVSQLIIGSIRMNQRIVYFVGYTMAGIKLELLNHGHERGEPRARSDQQDTFETAGALVKRETPRNPIYVDDLVIQPRRKLEQRTAQAAGSTPLAAFQDDIELKVAFVLGLVGR